MTQGRPLNVLYVMRTWAMGGGQTIALLLQRKLDPARFNIIAAPFDAPGDGDAKFAAAVERQGGQLAPERIPWHSRRDAGKARDTILRLVKQYDIDLIHTHDPQSNVIVGLHRKHFPCACVASPYGWWERWFPLRSHVYTWIEKNMALPRFERLITVSETMRGKILEGRSSPDRVRVVNTGIDLSFLDGGASRETVRQELGIPLDAPVVGTIGRVYVEKGHRFLLDAAQRLSAVCPNLHVMVVGEGPMKPLLETFARRLGIADRTVFTGYYPDLAGALRAMDVFALPSILDEGFPTVLLEAQAAGLPVVASNTGGTHETIAPGKTGLLVTPKRAVPLADALESLLCNPTLRTEMGKAAADWIRSSFTLGHMLDAVGQTYGEALEEYCRDAHRH